ncbi:ATP-dependent helicase, partial [Synechococcus sp. EJ6-Ellesmere]|nr:ATP-dependent helicase [Synechococcus sp. EJ6-Ellesmere]
MSLRATRGTQPRCLLQLGSCGLIEVISPFDPVTQAQLRRIRPAGRWRAQRHCWEFPLEAAGQLQALLGARFAIEPGLAQWLAWLRQPLPPLPPHRELVAAAQLEAP